MLSRTRHLSDEDIQQILQTTDPDTGNNTLSKQQFEKLYDASNSRIALVREHRFKHDCTLFRLARLLQSLTVFKTLSPDHGYEIIKEILHGLPFHYLSIRNATDTESCYDTNLHLSPITGRSSSNNLTDRTARIVALHDALANRINHVLGNTKDTPNLHLANLYNLGHAELLYRHRYENSLEQPDIEEQLNNIKLVLEQDLIIDGLKEKGKPGLAAEIFNPEQKQYSVSEHSYTNPTTNVTQTALHIIEIEKFHPYATHDLEQTTLPTELLNDYLYIQKHFQPGAGYSIVHSDQSDQKTLPFWLADLAPYEQYYIVADLHKIGNEVKELLSTELPNYNQEFAKRFRKKVDEKYSNTSAKGRQYPGLASLRRETRYIYLKNDENDNYTLKKTFKPNPEHFTSAGCPNPLRTHNRHEDKIAHMHYAAKNIASRLPHLIQQRIEWLIETFGPDFNLDDIKIHFNIVSLLSPIAGSSGAANTVSGFISRNDSDRLRENNEGRIVEVLDGAVQYLKNLQQAENQAESNPEEPSPEGLSQGKLAKLNSALAINEIKRAYPDVGNITIDFGLSVFGINKMGRGRAPLSSRGATGPAAGFNALADDCELFDNNWDMFCNTQGVTLVANSKEQLKGIISNTQHILRSPNPTSAQLIPWRDSLNNFLNSDQATNLGNGLEKLKELAQKISAATAYLQTDLPLENARSNKAQSTCFEVCKKTIKAAIFEKMMDKQAFLFACKSHHDRAEHRVAIANAIDVAEMLLGEFPNPSKLEHFELIIKCFIKEKFFVQSLSRARALSTNNIALKSHDSFALDGAPVWVQGLINTCAEEVGIDKEQCPYNDITPEETIKALEKMNFERMLKAFYSEGILGDFLEAPTPLSPEAIKPLSEYQTTHLTICPVTVEEIQENRLPKPNDLRSNSSQSSRHNSESSHASSSSSLWQVFSSLWSDRKNSASSMPSNSASADNDGVDTISSPLLRGNSSTIS